VRVGVGSRKSYGRDETSEAFDHQPSIKQRTLEEVIKDGNETDTGMNMRI